MKSWREASGEGGRNVNSNSDNKDGDVDVSWEVGWSREVEFRKLGGKRRGARGQTPPPFSRAPPFPRRLRTPNSTETLHVISQPCELRRDRGSAQLGRLPISPSDAVGRQAK